MGIFRLGGLLNKILARQGLRFTITGWGYLNAPHVCRQAELHGMSVGNFLEIEDAKRDRRHFGRRDRIVERVLQACSLPEDAYILEIGPGTARYMEKILQRFPKSNYEIYETAQDWVAYIKKTYGDRFRVINQTTDGRTLSSTKSASCDLVHAHAVFVYLPNCTTLSYLDEMARVCKSGGIIAFDVLSDSSFDVDILRKYIKEGHWFPVIFPETLVTQWAQSHGLVLMDRFDEIHGAHKTTIRVCSRLLGGCYQEKRQCSCCEVLDDDCLILCISIRCYNMLRHIREIVTGRCRAW